MDRIGCGHRSVDGFGCGLYATLNGFGDIVDF